MNISETFLKYPGLLNPDINLGNNHKLSRAKAANSFIVGLRSIS